MGGERGAPASAENPAVEAARREGVPYLPIWGAGYYAGPWNLYILPTAKVKQYPSFYDQEPRLGLQHIYLGDRQWGIQVPHDASPLRTYSLGPFQGVVGSPFTPDWLRRGETEAAVESPQTLGALRLLHAGQYRDAGRWLAKRFRESDDPIYPLLLAEALFAHGSFSNAELVLRHALEQPGAVEALPSDVAEHFPSREDFTRQLGDLEAQAERAPLLAAYLLLFGDRPDTGLERLAGMMAEGQDAAASLLYRHYLGRVFGPPEEAAEGDGAEAEGTSASADERPKAETTRSSTSGKTTDI